MTDLVYDYISMGVDMLVSAAILASVVILLRSSTVLTNYAAQQQATSDRLNYYKEYVAYDCTNDLLSPDVLSCIVYYRYDLDIVIIQGSNTISNERSTGKYKCNGSYISYDDLVTCIGSNKKYKANIYEDGKSTASSSGYQGGTITGIKFEQRSGGD